MARDDEGSPMRGKEGAMYIETKTEIEKSEVLSPVENLVLSFTELAKLSLANIKAVTNANKQALRLLVNNVHLEVANIENTAAAQGNIKVVDESILFRSLGGVS
jgi:hypothetical protein